MENELIRQHLLKAGVSNLHEFGYIYADVNNILTDEVYSSMFKTMLEENLGQSTTQVDGIIKEFLNTITANESK